MNSQVLCEPHSFARIRIKSSAPLTRVHVEVKVDGFSEVSSCDATLENADQQYLIAPTIRWDTGKLAFVDQPVPTTVVFDVKANNVDLGEQTTHLQVRAVNDVPYKMTDPEGNVRDRADLFAAFVNENSPVVDQLLHEALKWHSIPAFVGYQGKTPDSVRMQVFAVWNALQHRNVKYSSITTPSGFSDKLQSQSVRFVDQTVRVSEANCVDGSVLFASVLYKIGIHPVLVMKPGHMFLGYYLDAQSHETTQNLEFLETTMMGSGRLIRNVPFSAPNAVRGTPAYSNFIDAVKKGDEEFRSEVSPKLRENDPRYKVIGIRKARENGINPIPR
ncbi:MAG TPA: hypothetical protein VK788_10445 [Terriglobales bacterium]|nr:hypothetical protein [Terriglobales bacterium]